MSKDDDTTPRGGLVHTLDIGRSATIVAPGRVCCVCSAAPIGLGTPGDRTRCTGDFGGLRGYFPGG